MGLQSPGYLEGKAEEEVPREIWVRLGRLDGYGMRFQLLS